MAVFPGPRRVLTARPLPDTMGDAGVTLTTMPHSRTYTINEAASLSGRHPNTIRQKIKGGQIPATVTQGKFGDEYRIAHEDLVAAGLLPADGPLSEAGAPGPRLDTEVVEEGVPSDLEAVSQVAESSTVLAGTVQALGELYQRHEQAMFRLGYMQGELDRLKALEETAESLRRDNAVRTQEMQDLQTALAEKEQQAQEAARLRQELEHAQARLREMEALRTDIEQLKSLTAEHLAAQSQKHPWWQFWKA